MRKVYKVLIAVVAVVCLLAAWTLPVWAEEGGEVLPPMEDTGGGEAAPEEMPEADEPSVPPDATEDEGAKWDMDEVKAYINGTVIPAAVMVVTALAALYVALLPVFNKVKEAIAKFNKASGDITATAGESELTKKNTKEALDKLAGEYAQLLEQNEGLKAQYKALEGFVKGALAQMQDVLSQKTGEVVAMSQQIEKMLVVGFCNNRELMEKGFARKIAELGAGVDVNAKEEGHEQDGIEGGA